MTLAFLCTSASWGGLEMNIFRLALRMYQRGHTIIIYTAQNTPLCNKAHENGLHVEIIEVKRHYVAFGNARKLALSLKQHRVHTLLFSYAKDNYVASWAKYFFLKQLKLVYIQQMEVGINKKGLVQTFIYNQLDAWVAPLSLLREQVLQRTFMPPNRVTVIPLGIDVEGFSQHGLKKEEAREQLQLPKQAFIAGIIGRLDPAKGQEYLLKAVALLGEKNQEVHALIVGEDSRGDTRRYPQYLQKLAQELRIQPLTHFRPFTEQAHMAFAALDVFIMASASETYGMVTIEAMASGLPVIGTNVGGTPELLDFGKLGMLVPPRQEQALAEAIEVLLTQVTKREQLGKEAQKNAVERFDYKVQCSQLEQLLARVSTLSK